MKTITTTFESSSRSLLTSSAGSIFAHGLILLLVSASMRGCQKVGPGTPGGEPFRDVGLVVLEGVDGGAAEEGMSPGAGVDAETQQAQDQTSEASTENDVADGKANTSERLPSDAPDLTNLLQTSENEAGDPGDSASTLPPLIGPGNPIGGVQRPAQGGGSGLIKPTEAGGAARLGGIGGPGDTTFMNISGVGKTFVYVIDTSSSMDGNRLKLAQSQLKKSLRLLQAGQKFAVIFYNDDYRERLKLRRQAEQEMYFASELNKQLAAQEVDRVTADRGTDHRPAILEALSLKPDVIYFLTDGDEPALSSADLTEIAKRTGPTTIHVVKFGDGTLISRESSWLQRLARQSNGEFLEIKVVN